MWRTPSSCLTSTGSASSATVVQKRWLLGSAAKVAGVVRASVVLQHCRLYAFALVFVLSGWCILVNDRNHLAYSPSQLPNTRERTLLRQITVNQFRDKLPNKCKRNTWAKLWLPFSRRPAGQIAVRARSDGKKYFVIPTQLRPLWKRQAVPQVPAVEVVLFFQFEWN